MKKPKPQVKTVVVMTAKDSNGVGAAKRRTLKTRRRMAEQSRRQNRT